MWRTALSSRFHGVLPSTFGAGSGFMGSSYIYLLGFAIPAGVS